MFPPITRDTPIEDIHHIHKDIWNYVLRYGYKPATPYRSNCVLCQYAYMISGPCGNICIKCPAIWTPNEHGYCCSSESIYMCWEPRKLFPESKEKWREIVKQIRDIPFKYEKDDLKVNQNPMRK